MRFLNLLCVSLLLINGEITSGQTSETTMSISDPCYNYSTLDEYWRDIRQNSYNYYGHDDTQVEWSGWYRLYLNGESAQMSEWCMSYAGCGGYTALYLNDSHPSLEDGEVTREVLGSYMWSSQCEDYRSTSIQVKACPGAYYVYKLVKPDMSIYMPSYCAVVFSNISSDPCYNYESLDRPWRANNESGDYICDESFSWNGWYRLFYYGMNIQMTETCVNSYSCNTGISLWLNGTHPQIEDGVVTREVCGGGYSVGCCDYKTNPIRVKACLGNYYVYELVKPQIGCSGYCTDVRTISQPISTVNPNISTGSSNTSNYDPCSNYNILDNYRRSTLNYWSFSNGLDDTRVEWDGWYRLFINGASAQMPEWCFYYMTCGGFSSLYLGGSHPRLEDGVVTREVYGGSRYQCSRYRSEQIQVKACPGNYYVYKLTRPTLSIPDPVYCAVLLATPSVDPCYNYTSLDEPWRATGHSNIGMCDYNVEWNGWYRMFYNGQNTQMTESCVNHGMCGTHYPLSLNGPHPQLEDGVVLRQVCFSEGGCCASRSHPIRVKACPGNYYVYEFVKPMFCGAYCVEIFYPFGSAAGDTINAAVDDGNSSVIQLLSPFLFFGRTYQQIYVNNNGHLTFNQSSSVYVPYSFPARGSQDIIAGLWTNLDNRQRGVVSYQQFTSGNVLTRANRDINTHFPNLTFTASWVFVATWDKVAYFNLTNTETSFQVVLISGRNFSFILMNYGDIAVTGHPVQAGYDTINSTHYFVIPGSINGSFISNLRNSSNVDVPGRWVFRVDGGSGNSIVKNNVVGLRVRLSSFLDLNQNGSAEIVLQQVKQELVKYGLPNNIELKLRKLQKIKP